MLDEDREINIVFDPSNEKICLLASRKARLRRCKPILCEVSMEGDADLFEIDGEPAEDATPKTSLKASEARRQRTPPSQSTPRQ
jgi:hypothetical protein